MKHLTKYYALAVLLGCLAAASARATIVSFSFSGSVVYIANPSNAIPAGIVLGTPFSGTASYDTGLATLDSNLSTNVGDYLFGTNGGLIISVTMAGHTFCNVAHAPKDPPSGILVWNNLSGVDAFDAGDSMPNVRMDGGPYPGNPLEGNIYLDFKDTNNLTYNTDALPNTPPVLASYSDSHRIQLAGLNHNNLVFSINGNITSLSTMSQPSLAIKVLPNKSVLLSWPLSYSGFKLLQNTNAVAGAGWTTNATAIVDTATDHTVILPAAKSCCLFRLKSP